MQNGGVWGRVQDGKHHYLLSAAIHLTLYRRGSVFLALSSLTRPHHTSLQEPALLKYSVNNADCRTLKTDLQKPHNRIAECQCRSRCFPCLAQGQKIQGARAAAFPLLGHSRHY